ncbi:MAG: NADP-dependent phosphogluconate dehydrogenase [Patescibacteria group bacterium]
MKKQFQIGLIGLATMGANFARNFANHKISTLVFNRTTEKTDNFIKEFGNEYLAGAKEIKEFISKLERPRKIILMVQSGPAVDQVIEQLIPYLQAEDILIDCGNSHFKDTEKRQQDLAAKKINYIGCGISGGESGALHGPSLMPGGDKKAWQQIKPLFEKVSAKDFSGKPCVTYLGETGSGHFVKMVHNGIEYGLMQLIAESYDILKTLGKFSNEELSKIFKNFQKNSNLKSFLLEITAKILAKKDPTTSPKNSKYLIDLIKDSAKQKGTGKWTTFTAMDLGIAIPTINNAVDARIISGDGPNREISKSLKVRTIKSAISKTQLIKLVENSLELTSIMAYEQGFSVITKASKEYNWNFDMQEISKIWQGGCIIRSSYLKTLESCYSKDQKISQKANTGLVKLFASDKQKNWRKLISLAVQNAIPVPALYGSLSLYDAYAKSRLPQNLIQAQRDFFGAHTYERLDKPGTFHTDWEN